MTRSVVTMSAIWLSTVSVATISASGCSIFRLDEAPAEVEQTFADMRGMGLGCTPIVRRAERMARAELPAGGVVELWVAPTNEGGTMDVIVEKQADGESRGGSSNGCGGDAADDAITWSGGMATLDGDSGWVILSGRVPADADAVHVHFSGEDPIVTETQVDGYFMHALPITSMSEMDARSWPDSIDAVGADGEIIATVDLG